MDPMEISSRTSCFLSSLVDRRSMNESAIRFLIWMKDRENEAGRSTPFLPFPSDELLRVFMSQGDRGQIRVWLQKGDPRCKSCTTSGAP